MIYSLLFIAIAIQIALIYLHWKLYKQYTKAEIDINANFDIVSDNFKKFENELKSKIDSDQYYSDTKKNYERQCELKKKLEALEKKDSTKNVNGKKK